MENEDTQEWNVEFNKGRMNTVVQLNQTTPPVWGGTQNTITPRSQLLRKEVPPISGVFGGLICPLGSFNPSTISPNPSIMQTKEAFRTTRDFGESFSITLYHIDVNGVSLSFVEPIIANISFDGNVYSCQNEDLGIIAMSATLDDCIKDFKEGLLFVWNEYGKETDNRLTDDAKELKRRILSHVNQ
jgi:hypothetical protein